MTDQEIWEAACARVRKWKRGLCNERQLADHGNDLDDISAQCSHGYVRHHEILCPPIGDPACVVAMLEWLAREYEVPMADDEHDGQIVMVPDQDEPELWFGGDEISTAKRWHCRRNSYEETFTHVKLPLALAAAVNAPPEDSHHGN